MEIINRCACGRLIPLTRRDCELCEEGMQAMLRAHAMTLDWLFEKLLGGVRNESE